MAFSFEEAMNAAKETINGSKKATPKERASYTKSTVGHRRDVARFAVENGAQAAKEHYKTSETNVFKWLRDYRAGKYEGVPGDVSRKPRAPAKSAEFIEMQRLEAENKALRDVVETMVKTLRDKK